MDPNEALIDRDRQDLVTRQVLDESRLIRFVPAPDGSVAPDLARKLPGRGLWVEASRASVEIAVKKNLFARSAKAPLKPAADLADMVEKLLVRRCLDQLGLARREGDAGVSKHLDRGRCRRHVRALGDNADAVLHERGCGLVIEFVFGRRR